MMLLKKIKLIALSGTVLAGMTTAAQADPISVLVLGAVGLSASTVGATAFAIATSALTLSMSLGLSLVASMLNRPKKPVGGGTEGKLQAGGTVSRTIPLGRKLVTHSLVYANSDGRVSKTPNAVLTQVFALADVPVRGLAEIWVNGSKVTWTGTVGTQSAGGTYGYGTEIAEYPLHMFVKFYDGTQTEADSNLVSRFGSHATRPYGTDRIGTGVAYAIVSCVVNTQYFSGFPQFKFVVDGAPLYDPRLDTTAGGSGSQRWNDKTTWSVAPTNPMVQAYNLMRGMSYGSQWLYGGQSIGATQLPVSAWAAAMNECDVAISLAAGGSEPQFRSATELRFDEPPVDALKRILASCNGRIGERGGAFKPKVGAATSAVFSITDDDILSDASSTFEPFFSLDAIVNGVTGKYIEPREGWNAKDAPPIYTPSFELVDGGRRQTADLGFDAVTSATQVQRLMTAALADARRERRHQLPLPPDAFVLEPTDSISWTSARNGYTTKLFEIRSTRDLGGLLTGVSLSEVDPADYTWGTGNERAVALSSTAPFSIPSQSIVDWNATGVTLAGTDGSELPAIRMTWDGSVEDIDGIQFEVWNNAQTDLIYEGSTDRYEIGAIVISANIRPATIYKVRGRYRPVSTRPVAWSGYITVTTPSVQLVGPSSVELSRLSSELQTLIAGSPTAPETIPGIRQAIENFRRSVDPSEAVRSQAGEPVLSNVRREIDQLSETMAQIQQRFEQLRAANIEAGLEINSEEGRARIYALSRLTTDTTTRFNEVAVSLSALDARITLIANTVVEGDFDSLVSQITDVGIELDAVQASLSNYVLTTTFTPISTEVTTLRADLTAAQAAIVLRATQTSLDGATARITTAENSISALGSILNSVSAVTQALEIDLTNQTLAQVLALLADNKDAIVSEFANANNKIGARIDETGAAIASASLQLTALTTSTAAGFLSEQTARAAADGALTTSINSLTAVVNNPSTGLAAAKATADSAVSAAADADGKAVAADSKAVTAQNAANDAQADATSALGGLVTTNGAVSTITSNVNAIFGGNSANALINIGAAASSGASFSTIEFLARQTTGGTARSAGLKLGANNSTGFVEITAGNFYLSDPGWNGGARGNLLTWNGTQFQFGPPVLFNSQVTFGNGVVSTGALAVGAATVGDDYFRAAVRENFQVAQPYWQNGTGAQLYGDIIHQPDNSGSVGDAKIFSHTLASADEYVDVFVQCRIAAESNARLHTLIIWRNPTVSRIVRGSDNRGVVLVMSGTAVRTIEQWVSANQSLLFLFQHRDKPGAGTHTYVISAAPLTTITTNISEVLITTTQVKR
jgi:hypothetical protein